MNDWGFDDIETSTQKRASLKQRCPKCQQMAIIEVEHTYKKETLTTRIRRCVSCGDTWATEEKL